MRTVHGLKLAVCISLFAAVAHVDDDGADNWRMYNADAEGTRSNPAECTLSPSTVGGLAVKWTYPTPGAVTGTPAVVGNKLYVGDYAGNFYALKSNGTLLWSAQVAGSVSASALVKSGVVIFGDQAGFIYGYDRQTGQRLWSVQIGRAHV